MLTIIMPFYRKDKEFNFVFNYYNLKILNAYSNLELIIVIDDPNHYQDIISNLSALIEARRIQFAIKLLLNEQEHTWRPPCIAINVGIQQAKHNHLLVISPETILLENSLEQLYKHSNEETFVMGLIKLISFNHFNYIEPSQLMDENTHVNFYPYGSILFTKKQAMTVGGYNESFTCWGGDDDDFRYRLGWAGFNKKIILAKLLHVNLRRHAVNGSSEKKNELTLSNASKKIETIRNQKQYLANNGHFGQSYNQVIFDYNPNEKRFYVVNNAY